MSSGQTLIIFTPENAQVADSSFATFDTRNSRLVLDFDDTTNESITFSAVLPYQYGSGGLTVNLHYAMTAAIVGDIYWQAQIERIGDGVLDIDSDSFAAAQGSNETVPGTSGHISIIAITFTDGAQMDALQPGEAFRIKVTRDASSDTALGDAELLAVEIRET